MKISGGDKLNVALTNLVNKIKPGTVQIGFFSDATYPDGTKVALVAALNEYGHGIGVNPGEGKPDNRARVPPRPFFRNAIAENKADWPAATARYLKFTNYDTKRTLGFLGELVEGQVKQSITDLQEPPLRQSTIDRKGFAKPLIDTGRMRASVNYQVKTK